MALHVLPIFEHDEAFLFVVACHNKCGLLFLNSCATVISLGFCHKVECHKVIFDITGGFYFTVIDYSITIL